MRRDLRLAAVAMMAGVCTGAGLAQGTGQAAPQRAPDGWTQESIPGIFMTPIPNVPFTANVLIESTRVMEDGGTLTRHTYDHVARDSAGRVRLERREMLPASDTAKEPALWAFILIDMTAGTRTECNPFTKLCRVLGTRRGAHEPVLPAGPIGNHEYLDRLDLGHAQRAGLDAVGTRETITVQPQTAGNNRVMVSRKEIWYSPELQINVQTTRVSPKTGTDVLTVGNLDQGEPQPDLLAVPAGYRVVDERAPAPAQ